ncbi:SLATT domain-containing protein [Micromonospora sp. WMMD975]|uniref:SLATT domain-containing protein n=1 Tax=Micromonospora sp. WMMD975 TaxID=3016087 RepID=UPI00249BED5C|nr:SLATT domain-containing protein [Micromonospora sp. WMMD975]WFE31338.1 SLATT domain-containing protein [Micromonospora sp. WMMD975]
MTVRPFPKLAGEERPEVLLDQLREWAEGHAEDSIAWYLRDKAVRRKISRVLRGCAILLAVAGGMVPLVSAARSASDGSWGYVLLAVAGGCLAFDHFFGLSSAWMRDITAAQAIQRAVTEFRLDWAASALPGADPAGSGAASSGMLRHREALIRSLVMRTADLVEAETGEWLSEFRSNIGDLNRRSGWPSLPAHPSAGAAHSVDRAARNSDVTSH